MTETMGVSGGDAGGAMLGGVHSGTTILPGLATVDVCSGTGSAG